MQIRNIAIIAHVDHGKTTLVDKMLRQSGAFRDNQVVQERVMDSNPLERERGITILAKNTSIHWKDVKINVVDTPGHADFGGEVERILRMVDGVLLVVDAFDGPMPQTRFVLRKALELGRTPVIVINKIDRPGADPLRVHDEVLSLFIELEADEAQLDAPVVYASARDGVSTLDLDTPLTDLSPLFDTIVAHVPPPSDAAGPFQMLVSTIDYSPYLGRLAIGRIERGTIKVGDAVALLPLEPTRPMERGRVTKLFGIEGLERIEIESASAGEIVQLAGLEGVEIGLTVTDIEHPERLAGISVEEPTISVDFVVNNSPFAGKDGKFVTSRQLRERLYKELERNVALRVEDTESTDSWAVSGRGELHLSILMETMRREGYEFQVSRPRVITKEGLNGERLEPYEELSIDVPEDFLGAVMEKLGQRRAEMIEMKNPGQGLVRLLYRIPARGLFGYRSEFLTDTRGTGIMHHRYLEYGPWAGPLAGRSRGVLVSMENGTVVAFALMSLQERATLFVSPGDAVYEGMVVGENSRPGDMDVNPSKEKKLTNIRTKSTDENVNLEPPRVLTLESALEYIEDDELIEVTPQSIRLRKRLLSASDRKKISREAKRERERAAL
ncbi:GTP-binding protein TypA [Gemmatirosa kalamazoonensis]|uniref:Large ribosomal subunit assembly factor BipA n=1 Tax=Gemmatirosa kalamazoonensis TaxID=861299 RepID=W0RP91_9BACT|nr:translational GTPase TypA [Gemmatirosa kalamazoonensis]AHG91278.1 GTP-binding protein TypA [Gemmatirosa kalamazoonensis]